MSRCQFWAVVGVIWALTSAGQMPLAAAADSASDSASAPAAEAASRDAEALQRAEQLRDLDGFFAVKVGILDSQARSIHPKLGRRVAGVAIWRYLLFVLVVLGALLGGALVAWFLRHYAVRLTAKTRWHLDDHLISNAAQPAQLVVQALGIWLGLMLLVVGAVPISIAGVCTRLAMTVVAGAVLWYLYRLVDVADRYLRTLAERDDNPLDTTVVDVARRALRISVLVIGIVFIGNNLLDWDITALLASAGVVGLALAFAAQDTIANFFGTLMVLVDRPFRVGERVVIDGADGPVESIGFRSTRIRTLDGHLVTLPNKSVANAKVENVGRRPSIKRVGTLRITYDTPVEKVQKALQIVRDILAGHRCQDPSMPPRVNFVDFADCALTIQFIAWFHSSDFWEYRQWCEEVNLEIMRRFEAEGIEFAFPTSTTYLAQDPKRPLVITTIGAAAPEPPGER